MQATRLNVRAALMMTALLLAGCSTLPSQPADISGLRKVVGTDLIGAKGATADDQRKIGRTVSGLCAGGVWTPSECRSHGDAVK